MQHICNLAWRITRSKCTTLLRSSCNAAKQPVLSSIYAQFIHAWCPDTRLNNACLDWCPNACAVWMVHWLWTLCAICRDDIKYPCRLVYCRDIDLSWSNSLLWIAMWGESFLIHTLLLFQLQHTHLPELHPTETLTAPEMITQISMD